MAAGEVAEVIGDTAVPPAVPVQVSGMLTEGGTIKPFTAIAAPAAGMKAIAVAAVVAGADVDKSNLAIDPVAPLTVWAASFSLSIPAIDPPVPIVTVPLTIFAALKVNAPP